ncbi:MAG: GGDEF domain-containing protein [Woeseiaceae bacterium]
MSSPVIYILVALTLICAVISVTFLMAWRTLGEKPYTLSWSIAFLAATFQWALTLMPNWFPNVETYWLTISALSMAMITLGLRGHCQRTECKKLPQNLWPWSTVLYLIVVWTTVFEPHVGISTSLIPGVAAVTFFLSAAMIIRHREVSRPAEIATAITMVIFGMAQLAASVIAFMQGAVVDIFLREIYTHISFMSMPAGYAGIAIFVLFMVASDLSEEMKELAVSDQLTGLLNRRGFSERAAMAYAASRRTGRPVSVIMTDIDRFKQINDDFGHSAGDVALCHFSDFLQANRREDDVTARVGGEEFALILSGADLTEAVRIADELCDRIQATPVDLDGRHLVMTASFGVATISEKDTCLADVVLRADRALYRSKREGRNRIDLESSQMMLALDGSLKPVSA